MEESSLLFGLLLFYPFPFSSREKYRARFFLPDEIWMAELVHYLNFAGHHPLGFRVQFRLVDDLHSYFFWKAN